MRLLPILILPLLAACHPSIPLQKLEARSSLPEALPGLEPCVLVHASVEENLSNAAAGWFRGAMTLDYTSFLIRHPKGVLLIDASFGDSTDADVDQTSAPFRWLMGNKARKAKPLAVLLAEAGVRPEEVTHVLITHAHWDHTGGLGQVPKAKILLAKEESSWVRTLEGHFTSGVMPGHLRANAERLTPIDFDGPAYEGFPASFDLFGDGSIVAVSTHGHTPGSTSWFVNSGDGRRWLFAGDAAWVKEGFEEPVTKGFLASHLSDHDRHQTARMLGYLHAVHEAKIAPIVTSHDPRTREGVVAPCASP